MCRRAGCQLVLCCYWLILVSFGGCTSPETIRSRGLDTSSKQQYGWWVGPRGQDTAIDIGFRGKGLQIEVVRSYLSLARVDSPIGMRWTHNYLMHLGNASDRRLKLFHANGTQSMFSKTGQGTFTSEDGAYVLKQYSDGTHSFQDDIGTIFGFNRKGRLTHIKGHQYGNTISLAYGADGYLESISDSQGQVITFSYDSETHRLSSIRDGKGRSVTYKHDDVGNLISVTNSLGVKSKYSYDRQHHLVGVTFP